MNVEIETLKKTQIEVPGEMKNLGIKLKPQ